MAFRISSEDSGATAIEYAVIAGLIGLGIVGSLVATKGSLNSVFGTASSQMASTSQAAATPVSRAQMWQSRTQSKPPQTYNSDQPCCSVLTRYTYTDGSMVDVQRYTDGRMQITVNDLTAFELRVISADAKGLPSVVDFYKMDANNAYPTERYNSTSGTIFAGSPPTPQFYDTTTYVGAGYQTSTKTRQTVAGSVFAPFTTTTYADYVYFRETTP